MKDQLNKMDPLSRRKFAAGTASAAFGLSLMPTLETAMAQSGSVGKAKHLIYFYMGGGMTHIDSFDPKPEAPSEYAGPIGSIGTNVDGIRLGAYFTNLAKKADKLAIVNSLNGKTGAHDGGRYWMLTGYQKRATIVHPEMLAWKQEFHNKNDSSDSAMPKSFIIGGGGLPGAGFFGPSHAPLPIGDPNRGLPNSASPTGDQSREEKRMDALATFNEAFTSKFKTREVKAYNEYYDNTMKFLKSDELEVFDLSKEPDAERQKFGMGRMGQGALLAARLVEKGVGGVRVGGAGSCDNHGNIQTSFQGPANTLDQALSALIDRLEASGKLDETLIVVGTEFGRTPKINANAGRDHYPRCFSGLMVGGGVVGGQVYGKTDVRGVSVEENPVSPEDYNATIATALGIPLDKIVFAPSGRPFLIAGHTEDTATKEVIPVGKPIMPFFG
ncbi:MAG: DUF1501 domain-containing protein [Verrucomicrobiota bacterium]